MPDRNTSFNSRRDRSYRRNQNTIAFQPSVKLGPISHTVLVAMMVAVLGLIYLTQITKTSSFAGELNRLNIQKDQLVEKKSNLEVETARLKSLQKVKSSEVAQSLAAPASTEYVRN